MAAVVSALELRRKLISDQLKGLIWSVLAPRKSRIGACMSETWGPVHISRTFIAVDCKMRLGFAGIAIPGHLEPGSASDYTLTRLTLGVHTPGLQTGAISGVIAFGNGVLAVKSTGGLHGQAKRVALKHSIRGLSPSRPRGMTYVGIVLLLTICVPILVGKVGQRRTKLTTVCMNLQRRLTFLTGASHTRHRQRRTW